jgi:hypothetical protein
MESIVALGDVIGQLDQTDMAGAQQMGQELTELEANELANLQHLAKRLMEITKYGRRWTNCQKGESLKLITYLLNIVVCLGSIYSGLDHDLGF